MALTEKLTAIGNAIRSKTGGTDPLTLDQMPSAIKGISGGSDSGTGGYIPEKEYGEITIAASSWDGTSAVVQYFKGLPYDGSLSVAAGLPKKGSAPNAMEVQKSAIYLTHVGKGSNVQSSDGTNTSGVYAWRLEFSCISAPLRDVTLGVCLL